MKTIQTILFLLLSTVLFAQTDEQSRGVSPQVNLKKSQFPLQIIGTNSDKKANYMPFSWLLSGQAENNIRLGTDGKLYVPSNTTTSAATNTFQVNALSVGARNDGVSFSPTALNNYLSSLNGTAIELVFPSGTYLMNCSAAPLVIPSNTTLSSVGGSPAKIKVIGSPNADTPPITTTSFITKLGTGLPSESCQNITIQNLEFDGNKALTDTVASGNYAGNILFLFGVRNLSIKNCTIRNVKNDAIVATICQNVRIENNTIRDVCKAGIYSSGNYDVHIHHNTLRHIEGRNPANNTKNWGFAFQVSGSWNVTMANNIADSVSCGLLADRDTKNLLVQNNLLNANIADRNFINIGTGENPTYGYQGRGATTEAYWGVSDALISNNTGYGFVWFKGAQNVTFQGNRFQKLPAWTDKMVYINSSRNCSFLHNELQTNTASEAFYFFPLALVPHGIFGSTNTDWNIGNRIENNLVTITDAAPQYVSLVSMNTAAKCNNNFVSLNRLSNLQNWPGNFTAQNPSIIFGFTAANTGSGNQNFAFDNIIQTLGGGLVRQSGSF